MLKNKILLFFILCFSIQCLMTVNSISTENVIETYSISKKNNSFNVHKFSENLFQRINNFISTNNLIIYKDYDGSIISFEIVKDGESIVGIPDPKMDGYKFIGWNIKNDPSIMSDVEIAQIKVVSNMTFIAKYKSVKQ